jgi:hypothetical protein
MSPINSNLETQFTFETEATPIADNPPFKILLLGDWSGRSENRFVAKAAD